MSTVILLHHSLDINLKSLCPKKSTSKKVIVAIRVRMNPKAEHDLSSLSCVCVYVDQNKATPTPGNGISTMNSLISSPDLDSPQKISLV